MTLTYATPEGTNLVTVAFDGDLDTGSVHALRDHVESVIDTQGSARLLIEYGNAGSTPPRAVLEDLKNASFVKKIDKGAIVTDSKLVNGLAGSIMLKTMVPFPVKTFTAEQHGKALEWVTA